MNSVAYRKRQIDSRRQRRPISPITLIAAALGLLLLAAGLYPSLARRAAAVPSNEAVIATQAPFIATHDMGQGPAIPFLPASEPQPRIAISEARYDFGRIGARDVVERTFLLRNDGQSPLTISRAYTTCACTTAHFSASVIPPGQAATVKVIFDAGYHNSAGQTVQRGIIIENNDPSRPQVEFWFQAVVNNF